MTFKNLIYQHIISEMETAGYGNWKPSRDTIGTKGATGVLHYWKFLNNITTKSGLKLEIRYLNDEYIVGRFIKTDTNDDIFEMLLSMKLRKYPSITNIIKTDKRVMNVDSVNISNENNRIDGISTQLYSIIVKYQDIILLGDELQYFGARKLWTRLSKKIDVVVDIIDIDKNEVIEKNCILYHGTEDWDFDNRVWSYTSEKKHIRLILKDIIGEIK